jgi:hypothetical protein
MAHGGDWRTVGWRARRLLGYAPEARRRRTLRNFRRRRAWVAAVRDTPTVQQMMEAAGARQARTGTWRAGGSDG